MLNSLNSSNTYRSIYQKKKIERKQIHSDRFFQPENPFFFQSSFRNPSTNPFKPYQPFEPTTSPLINRNDPLNPYFGGLILPQNPSNNLRGQPRIYPTSSFVDPFYKPRDFFDPDMI